MPDARAYLDLLDRRCEQVRNVLADMTAEEFLEDLDTQALVFMWHHDIGEAVNQLTTKFPEYRHRITKRRSIIGSRSAMSHQLFSRDWQQLWTDLQNGLPVLQEEVATFIAELD